MQAIKPKTAEMALGRWPGILAALGVDERFLGKKHCECPFCGGTDRFRFDDRNGTGSFICSQCGSGDGIEFLKRNFQWSFREAAMNVDSVLGTVAASKVIAERSEADKVAAIRKTLRECRRVVHGDPVWKYLNQRTGIEIIPADIRFHPGLYHSDGGNHPTMVSVMRDRGGHGVSVHRTYLTEAGDKANVNPVKKFMAGKPLNGAAVRLSRLDSCIGIAEGIETALAASRRFGVYVWAATNATLLEQFMPPDGVGKVLVYGDNDTSWTGQAAAYNLAKRLTRDKILCEVHIPGLVDRDWCDEG